MLDFTSSLYLGFHHASAELRPWAQLSTGAPAALVEPESALRVAQRLAALQGCQRTTLATSSWHLFWDVFDQLARCNAAVILEDSSYPIARWGATWAAGHGTPVFRFAHRDAIGLHRGLAQVCGQGRRPVLVTDGVCTCCGCVAPLRAYAETLRPHGGLLIVDDTQALGLLGPGGGGSARHHGLRDQNIVLISSLAKAFGVPIAAMSGSAKFINWFEARSQTRVHCSPPSAAALHAAEHALDLNEAYGDEARKRLAQRVHVFQSALAQAGLPVPAHRFAVQTVAAVLGADMDDVHAALEQMGVKTVLHSGEHGHNATLSFILTAKHRAADIAQAVHGLSKAIERVRQRSTLPELAQTKH
jgi:8-amino-7-oxononanoate synthase